MFLAVWPKSKLHMLDAFDFSQLAVQSVRQTHLADAFVFKNPTICMCLLSYINLNTLAEFFIRLTFLYLVSLIIWSICRPIVIQISTMIHGHESAHISRHVPNSLTCDSIAGLYILLSHRHRQSWRGRHWSENRLRRGWAAAEVYVQSRDSEATCPVGASSCRSHGVVRMVHLGFWRIYTSNASGKCVCRTLYTVS